MALRVLGRGKEDACVIDDGVHAIKGDRRGFWEAESRQECLLEFPVGASGKDRDDVSSVTTRLYACRSAGYRSRR